MHDVYVVDQLRQEKCELEETLEKEQEYQVNKLMRRIEKLQAEVVSKQATLDQVLQISNASHSFHPSPPLFLSLFFLTPLFPFYLFPFHFTCIIDTVGLILYESTATAICVGFTLCW